MPFEAWLREEFADLRVKISSRQVTGNEYDRNWTSHVYCLHHKGPNGEDCDKSWKFEWWKNSCVEYVRGVHWETDSGTAKRMKQRELVKKIAENLHSISAPRRRHLAKGAQKAEFAERK